MGKKQGPQKFYCYRYFTGLFQLYIPQAQPVFYFPHLPRLITVFSGVFNDKALQMVGQIADEEQDGDGH